MNKSLISPYQVQQKGRKKYVKQIHHHILLSLRSYQFFPFGAGSNHLETEGKFLRESAGSLPWCWREEPTCLDPAEDVKMGMAYRLIWLFGDWMIGWFPDWLMAGVFNLFFVFEDT